MKLQDNRGKWRANKTPEELAVIYKRQLEGRMANWFSKPSEERKVIVSKRSASLKATWDKKKLEQIV